MLSNIKQRPLLLSALCTLLFAVPLWGITAEEQAWVRRSINSLINKHGLSGRIGITITSLRDQSNWYRHASQETFVPASNQKLCTTAAALSILGPDYRFTTELLTDGHKKRSTLIGNIYIRGAGDPTLTHQNLQALVRQLKRQRTRAIRGNLILDLSTFDTISFHPYWFGSYRNKGWCPHVSALMVDRSCSPRYINIIVRRALKRYGIMLTGKLIIRKAPENATVLASHTSEPISEIIKPLLKRSDNLYAECLFKTLGAERFGTPGTWQKGSQAVIELFNDKLGIDASRFHIVDGSGISHKNLLAPDHLTTLLSWCRYQPFFKEFLDALPTAGRDGTLKYRMTQPGIATHIKAKTGTLSDVSSLSGYIIAKDKTPLIFSIMSNRVMGKNEHHKRLEDKICSLLAQFASQETLPTVTLEDVEQETDEVADSESQHDTPVCDTPVCDAQECDTLAYDTPVYNQVTQEQEASEDASEIPEDEQDE